MKDKPTESPAEAQEPQLVTPAKVAAPFGPATYTLVGIDPNAKDVHIAEMNREYSVAELRGRLDILEYLHQRGNPLVVKS